MHVGVIHETDNDRVDNVDHFDGSLSTAVIPRGPTQPNHNDRKAHTYVSKRAKAKLHGEGGRFCVARWREEAHFEETEEAWLVVCRNSVRGLHIVAIGDTFPGI